MLKKWNYYNIPVESFCASPNVIDMNELLKAIYMSNENYHYQCTMNKEQFYYLQSFISFCKPITWLNFTKHVQLFYFLK